MTGARFRDFDAHMSISYNFKQLLSSIYRDLSSVSREPMRGKVTTGVVVVGGLLVMAVFAAYCFMSHVNYVSNLKKDIASLQQENAKMKEILKDNNITGIADGNSSDSNGNLVNAIGGNNIPVTVGVDFTSTSLSTTATVNNTDLLYDLSETLIKNGLAGDNNEINRVFAEYKRLDLPLKNEFFRLFLTFYSMSNRPSGNAFNTVVGSFMEKMSENGKKYNMKSSEWAKIISALKSDDVDVNMTNREGKTLLHLVCINKSKGLVEALLNAGANIGIKDNDGKTPLHHACQKGHVKVVEFLLNKEADINIKDNEGYTPLHYACDKGHVEVVEFLFNKGADINIKENGYTPLHHACAAGHVKVVEFLLNKEADINIKDNEGYTPLHHAFLGSKDEFGLDLIKVLLKKGADISIKDNDGRAPLHYACTKGHVEVVEFLLNKGVDISIQDNGGDAPLHHACAAGHVKVVEFLLNKKADIDIKDNEGYTPLHHACAGGHVEVVKLLLNKGADIGIEDNKGKTPLDYHLTGDIENLLNQHKKTLEAQRPSITLTTNNKDMIPMVPQNGASSDVNNTSITSNENIDTSPVVNITNNVFNWLKGILIPNNINHQPPTLSR